MEGSKPNDNNNSKLNDFQQLQISVALVQRQIEQLRNSDRLERKQPRRYGNYETGLVNCPLFLFFFIFILLL